MQVTVCEERSKQTCACKNIYVELASSTVVHVEVVRGGDGNDVAVRMPRGTQGPQVEVDVIHVNFVSRSCQRP